MNVPTMLFEDKDLDVWVVKDGDKLDFTIFDYVHKSVKSFLIDNKKFLEVLND